MEQGINEDKNSPAHTSVQNKSLFIKKINNHSSNNGRGSK
ncbi:hypothetical protein SAMN04487930_101575 [Cytophaga hutchinsonii ATCC 33406]|nr:hypothetical protein SAMN04487930_101575 [Cytophaga hutchinsonii ATCC 33406]